MTLASLLLDTFTREASGCVQVQSKTYILIVEDNPDDEVFLRRAVAKTDDSITLVLAKDGIEAMGLFMGSGVFAPGKDALKPFLILLDLHIPKLNGLVLLQSLRSALGAKTVPIVVVSASKEEIVELESMTLGADDFVHKPMTVEKMRDLISRYRPSSH